jgi:hypothetical protein
MCNSGRKSMDMKSVLLKGQSISIGEQIIELLAQRQEMKKLTGVAAPHRITKRIAKIDESLLGLGYKGTLS